jgi:hypothetical protein
MPVRQICNSSHVKAATYCFIAITTITCIELNGRVVVNNYLVDVQCSTNMFLFELEAVQER